MKLMMAPNTAIPAYSTSLIQGNMVILSAWIPIDRDHTLVWAYLSLVREPALEAGCRWFESSRPDHYRASIFMKPGRVMGAECVSQTRELSSILSRSTTTTRTTA